MTMVSESVASSFDGAPVNEVVREVKEAIQTYAKETAAQDQGVGLKSVELTLNVTTSKDVEGKPKFKIPFLEWEIGTNHKLTREETQEIVLTLEPSVAVDLFERDDVGSQVLDALRIIGDIAHNAAVGEPRLTLKDGSVELKFVVTRDHGIEVAIVGADYSKATTHSLKVTIGTKDDES
jgi:hypothetical protein